MGCSSGKQDYHKFLIRSLSYAIRKGTLYRSMGKEFVAGGRGKPGLFEVLCFSGSAALASVLRDFCETYFISLAGLGKVHHHEGAAGTLFEA